MDARIKSDPEQVFECYVEYIRPQDGQEPELKRVFPKNHQFDEDLKKNLSKFVFPTKDSQTNAEEHFTFCLTDLQGTFRFGFCRYPARGDMCSCFISDLPWFKVFYKILDKLAECQLDHQNELIDPFLSSLYKYPVPSVGNDTVMTIIPEGIHTGQVYTFPLPNPKRLPEIPTDHNLTLFYPTLHHQVILCLYANLLFERRIIITSSSLKTLSAAVHGCVLLLYPLFWQHIFIPITPHHLIDYCAAPMPFLMGIHSSMMEQVRSMPINDAVILDVDQSELESPYYEDLLNIPPFVSSVLRSTIKKSSSAYGDTAAKAFLQANVALLGGYRSALKMREGESEVSFDRESFIKSRPQMEEFLASLLEFQHFQQFLNGRIERLKSNKERDLFDDEAIIYEEELKLGKFSSDQMKVAWKDMKDIFQKHGTKVAKNTKILMKDTKTFFQKGNERTGDIYGEWTPGLGTNRSSTLPIMGGGGGGGGEGRIRSKAPPPVIPYTKHKEGMEKLTRSIQEQNKRLSIVRDTPFILTTPTNEHRHTPDESAESASISSKDSLEVPTDQLVDIGDHAHIDRVPTPIIFRPGCFSEEGETDSASIVSSSSSSSGGDIMGIGPWEVKENKHAESPPTSAPVPPPRKKHLKDLSGGTNGRGTPPSNKPFEMYDMSSSMATTMTTPSSDLGSTIAEALIQNSRRISDPLTAHTVSNTGHELHKLSLQLQNDTSFNSMNDLLVSTHATPTFNTDTTTEPRPQMSSITELESDAINDPWKPIVNHDETTPNPFKPGGASPGQSRHPPMKPQPYSGSGLKFFEKMHTGAILTPSNISTLGGGVANETVNSNDPLSDLFGHDGLHGYALK